MSECAHEFVLRNSRLIHSLLGMCGEVMHAPVVKDILLQDAW